MNLQHIAVKIFARPPCQVDPASLIPVFHGWIQRKVMEGMLLVDVADYAHVPEGPGVLLLGREGYFGFGSDYGGAGLIYANKRSATGTTQDRLHQSLHRALTAAKLLADEPTVAGKLRFDPGQLLIAVDDRLEAPNTADSFAALKGDIEKVLTDLYDASDAALEQVENPKSALRVKATITTDTDLPTLAQRTIAQSPIA